MAKKKTEDLTLSIAQRILEKVMVIRDSLPSIGRNGTIKKTTEKKSKTKPAMLKKKVTKAKPTPPKKKAVVKKATSTKAKPLGGKRKK